MTSSPPAILKGPAWGPRSGGAPRHLVVLCHGFNAGGDQVIGMAGKISVVLPDAVFCAPNGPEVCDRGPPTRQWFSLDNLDAPRLRAGVRKSALVLDAFINQQLEKYALPATAYALAGFSQGAMMVLFTGLRRPAAPRAIVAYAGALIDPLALPGELANRAPVLLAHGAQDDVVPLSRSEDAARSLRRLGVPVETAFTPKLGHNVGAEGTAAAIDFLRRGFAA